MKLNRILAATVATGLFALLAVPGVAAQSDPCPPQDYCCEPQKGVMIDCWQGGPHTWCLIYIGQLNWCVVNDPS